MTKLVSLFLFVFLSTSAWSQETALELNVKTELNSSDTIGLNKLIANQYRNISIDDLEIARVVVEAKSKEGQGLISLIIGNLEGSPLRVPANPDFASIEPSTFFSLKLNTPRLISGSKTWQLKAQGSVKLNRIVLFVKINRVRPPMGQLSYKTVSTFKLQKFLEVTKNIEINSLVKAINLNALKNDVQVIEARALLNNGSEVYLDELSERIKKGKNLSHRFESLPGLKVKSLFIRAVSPNLLGSRADLEVQTGL